MNVLPARLMGREYPRKSLDRHLLIEDPDVGPVGVRWALGRSEPWRCRECGPMAQADCAHTFAAGLVLAEKLLGLTRAPELHPDAEEGTAT